MTAAEAFFVSGRLLDSVPLEHHFEVFLTYVQKRAIASAGELLMLHLGRASVTGRGG